MVSVRTDTIYQQLLRVAVIEDDNERATALRDLLATNRSAAIVVQRVYHPNYNFLVSPDVVASVASSNHDSAGPLLQSLKQWYLMRPAHEVPMNHGLSQKVRDDAYANAFSAVATDDSELLLAVINKKLPWDSLNQDFVGVTVPEMFPDGFRTEVGGNSAATVIQAAINTPQLTVKQQCADIMRANPGLKRKDYLEKFKEIGVKDSTAGLYYQELKDVINA
jgi:hypothetical protein